MSEAVANVLGQPERVATLTAAPPPVERRSRAAAVLAETFGNVGARLGLAWIATVATLGVLGPLIASSHPILMKADGRWSSPMWRMLAPEDVALLIMAVAFVADLFAHRRRDVFGAALRSLCLTSLLVPILWWPQIVAAAHALAMTVSEGHLTSAVAAFFRGWWWTLPWTLAFIAFPVAVVVLIRWTPWPRRALVAHAVGFVAAVTLLLVVPPRPSAIVDFTTYRELERAGKVQWVARTLIPFSPTDRLRDLPSFDERGNPHPFPPSRAHWMGTELNRSDIASRMIHACRIAMTLGFIATGLSTLIGIVVGAVTGYFAGWVDLIGQRIIEVFSAIPTLFLMLAAVAFFGRGLYMMMLIIGLTGWVGTARFVRAEFLRYRNVDFVQAARALGLPLPSILFKHLLPNALAPVLVEVSFGVAGAILAESALSFLGLGLIDEPSWGALLNQAVGSTGGFQWWLAVFPGVAIFLTVMAYNLIGESLRDALDPKLRQRE